MEDEAMDRASKRKLWELSQLRKKEAEYLHGYSEPHYPVRTNIGTVEWWEDMAVLIHDTTDEHGGWYWERDISPSISRLEWVNYFDGKPPPNYPVPAIR